MEEEVEVYRRERAWSQSWVAVPKQRHHIYFASLTVCLLSPQSGGFMDMFGMMNDMIGNMV